MTRDAARRSRRAVLVTQPRNERGQIIIEHVGLASGNGTLPRDIRAHLAGDKVRPKACRCRKHWPSVDPDCRAC